MEFHQLAFPELGSLSRILGTLVLLGSNQDEPEASKPETPRS